MDRADLEAQLRAHWRRQDLAIYADLLESEGDPRGELIAIHLAQPDDNPELAARRDELLDAWGVPHHFRERARSGFLRTVTSGSLHALETVLGPYVQRAELSSAYRHISQQLDKLIAAPRPWLTELKVNFIAVEGDEPQMTDTVIASRMLTLHEHAPHLAHATITGRWLPALGAGKELATLALDYNAFGELCDRGEHAEAVRELVVTSRTHEQYPIGDLVTGRLAHQLPALRRLDFTDRSSMRVQEGVFGWLEAASLVTQLDELVVPPVRTDLDLGALERIRGRFAGKLAVSRAYTSNPWHVDGVTVPPRRPWPPRERVQGVNYRRRVHASIALDDLVLPVLDTPYVALVDELEHLADRDAGIAMPWLPVFELLGAPPRSCTLPFATIYPAAETLDPSSDPVLRGLCLALRAIPADRHAETSVRIEIAD